MRRTHTTSIYVQSRRRTVASVLVDVERYREWLPGVERAKVLAREDRTVVVEVEASHWGRGRFLFELVFEAGDGISFRQVGRLRDRGVSGSVSLTDADEGVVVQIEVSAAVAGLFGRARREVARAVSEASHALDLRVQKAVLGSLPTRSSRRGNVLEVRQRGDGYELWFQGKRWRLVEETGRAVPPPGSGSGEKAQP